jgi:cytoskeletal protein CcmA (bactofilin family)
MFLNSKEPLEPVGVPMRSSEPAYHAGTVIARGVKVEGDFTSQGDVVIDGDVRGNITAGGKLTVGSDAVIKADLHSEEAVISGDVTGNVTVAKQLTLHPSAKILGDVTCERITVESGATLEGKLKVGTAALEPAKEKPKEIKADLAVETAKA